MACKTEMYGMTQSHANQLSIGQQTIRAQRPDDMQDSDYPRLLKQSLQVSQNFGKAASHTQGAEEATGKEWTLEESRLLFQFQKQFGTCWCKIAKMLSRTGNSVKNHYYSAFRRATRLLNKFADDYCQDFRLKSVTNRMLLNILTATEEVKQGKTKLSSVLATVCQDIKARLSRYTIENDGFEPNEVVQLIRQITDANQKIKIQKSKHKKSIIQAIKKKKQVSSNQTMQSSQIPSVFSPHQHHTQFKPINGHQPIILPNTFDSLQVVPMPIFPLQSVYYYWC